MTTTKNFAEVIRRKLASNESLAALVDRERFGISVGYAIQEARTSAGLTQKQLADRTGMQQSAIARLENADSGGHSLTTLERIASALGKRIVMAFVDSSAGAQEPLTAMLSVDILDWESLSKTSWTPTITTTSSTHSSCRETSPVA